MLVLAAFARLRLCSCPAQTTVTSFRVGWNFSDGESIASAQDVFPSQGQLAALTLADSQVRASGRCCYQAGSSTVVSCCMPTRICQASP